MALALCLAAALSRHIAPVPVELAAEGVACFDHADCLSSEMCQKQRGERQGVCVFSQDASEQDLLQEMGAQVLTAAGLNVSSLTINAGSGKESKIILGEGAGAFSLAIDTEGTFAIKHGSKAVFNVDKNGNIQANGKLHTKGALRVDGQLEYMGLSQWFLAFAEDFSKTVTGWTNVSTSTCGSQKYMLGGFGRFAGGEVHKTYRGLATHNELRLKANLHFIDSWEGETAYCKLNQNYVWSDVYDHTTAKAGINICGGTAAEGKYSVPIDVVIPHNSTSVSVTFGSTLDQSAYEESWGVDDIMIWLR